MPPFNVQPRAFRPVGCLLRAGYASQKPQIPPVPRRTAKRPPPIPPPPRSKSSSQPPPPSEPPQEQKQSSIDAISGALRTTNAEDNNLLSPVHVPEDPNGILTSDHPATSILANSAIVVTRQLELMNVMVGFEQANKYVIMNPQGNHIGYMAERELGMGNVMARQMAGTHRSFTTHIFDKHEEEVLRFHRPFAWINSRISIYDPTEPQTQSTSTIVANPTPESLTTKINPADAKISQLALSEMRLIGEARQVWAPLRRKYDLFLHCETPPPPYSPDAPRSRSSTLPLSPYRQPQDTPQSAMPPASEMTQFAHVDEPFLSWDFSLLSADSKLLGSVNRNFAGFGREFFTDTGVYALRMDAAGIAQEPGHIISKTGKTAEVVDKEAGMTLDQRAIMLATAVSVDFDYFSRKSSSGGMGAYIPLWFPGMGGGAPAEAGAEGGAVEGGALEGAGDAAKGAGGAAVGAGSVAGYEGMQRGAYGDDASPQVDGDPYGGAPQERQPGQIPEGEDVWGGRDDPWGGDKGGGGEVGGEGGGDGGGDWIDFDFL